MSERMTSVRRRGQGGGIAESGRRTRAEMVERYRAYYAQQLAEARDALAATDEDLIVETYLGPWAMRNREEVK